MTVTPLSVAALLLCCAAPAAAQNVSLEFQNGRVTLRTENAPVRQILAEWARLGGTRIVNGERVPGAPMTLELVGVPERQALDVLLRNVSGYMVAARDGGSTGASTFDRILILPTTSAPRPAAAPAFVPPPVQPQPRQPVPFDPEDPEENPPEDVAPPDDDVPVDAGSPRPRNPRDFVPPNVNGRPIPPQPFQPDPEDEPEPEEAPAPTPGNPFGIRPGSATPGVITPVPQQPQNRQRQPDPEP